MTTAMLDLHSVANKVEESEVGQVGGWVQP